MVGILISVGILVAVLASGGGTYAKCVSNANGDQTAIQQCVQQYQNKLNG